MRGEGQKVKRRSRLLGVGSSKGNCWVLSADKEGNLAGGGYGIMGS